MKLNNFIPANNSEKLLATLPKECSCHMCETAKKEAMYDLGKKRFYEICKILNIWTV
jgi:hypothetical protein